MRMLYAIVVSLGLSTGGCAHADASHGFEAVQTALALSDVAFHSAVKNYRAAVDEVRRHCGAQPDPDACEEKMHVTEDDVEQVIEASIEVRDAYEATVIVVDELQSAHGELSPRMQRVLEASRALGE